MIFAGIVDCYFYDDYMITIYTDDFLVEVKYIYGKIGFQNICLYLQLQKTAHLTFTHNVYNQLLQLRLLILYI